METLENLDLWVWLVLLALALAIGALIAWSLAQRQRRKQFQERFGPEYDRVQHETGSRRQAEAELERREQRVSRLDIQPLSAGEQAHFADEWRTVQKRFVDEPAASTRDADRLVNEVMDARGYPMGDFEQRAEDISVDHPRVVQNYRAAREIAVRNERGEADTEDLRQAFVHYRELFDDLLDTSHEPGTEAHHERTA